MVRPIPKEGRVVRLTKETLEGLLIYDSDANLAFQKMKAALNKNASGPSNSSESIVTPAAPNTLITHSCRFDETKLKTVIKTTMEEVIAPFTGGP